MIEVHEKLTVMRDTAATYLELKEAKVRIAELEKLNALLNKQLSEANATLAAVRLTLGRKV